METDKKQDVKPQRSTAKIPLERLVICLSDRGYRNYGKQGSYSGELLQRKHESGCFFNFYLHAKDDVIHLDMVSAEICFECSDIGQWCKHSLYGVSVEKLVDMIDDVEEKLFAIFVKYEGRKYI